MPPTLQSPQKPGPAYIREMFDGFAERYDWFTLLIGFGQAGRLRDEALKEARSGMKILDLACGTGDLALAALTKVGTDGKIVGLDFSENMLRVARGRFKKSGLSGDLRFVCKSAEDLPIGEGPFDLIVSGFALRNLYENIHSILAGVRASLSENGRIAFLDLTEPGNRFLKTVYRAYFFVFVGVYGSVLFKNYPIAYLPDSSIRFLSAGEFTAALTRAGFQNVRSRPFMLGAVTLYTAGTR